MPLYLPLFALGMRQVVSAWICLGPCLDSSMRLRRMATASRPSSHSRPQWRTWKPSKVSAVLIWNLLAASRTIAGVMAFSSAVSRSRGS
eukprot:16442640-Heterocapsa_arctica.AAC.1